jgi:hypothetical protein
MGYDVRNKSFSMHEAAPFYATVLGSIVAKKIIAKAGVNKGFGMLPFRL